MGSHLIPGSWHPSGKYLAFHQIPEYKADLTPEEIAAALRRHEDDVRIPGIDDDAADLPDRLERPDLVASARRAGCPRCGGAWPVTC